MLILTGVISPDPHVFGTGRLKVNSITFMNMQKVTFTGELLPANISDPSVEIAILKEDIDLTYQLLI